MDRHELAWAAGFFDGEGWANSAASKGRQTRQPHARINQAGSDGVPEVLLRFQRALGGLGRIGGPQVDEGRKDLYRWEVSSRGDVELLLHLLAPWLGAVKSQQIASALGRGISRVAVARPTGEWRAWAAGLYDGEGSTYLLDHRSHEGYRIAEAAITQLSDGGAPEVLRRFAAVVGVGHINGPYSQRDAHAAVYRWKSRARRDVERLLAIMWPWLSAVKRAQAQQVLDVIYSQADLPRGNPAWGNRKTPCVHGHEYATARIRPYVARGKVVQRRENQQCLVCVRDYARKQREEKRSASEHDCRSL